MLGSVLVAGTTAMDEKEDILAFWSFLSLRETESEERTENKYQEDK